MNKKAIINLKSFKGLPDANNNITLSHGAINGTSQPKVYTTYSLNHEREVELEKVYGRDRLEEMYRENFSKLRKGSLIHNELSGRNRAYHNGR